MSLLLLLFWCSAVIGYGNSRNSRLGRREFPCRVATGIRCNLLNSLAVFALQWRLGGQNRKSSRYHGKNRDYGSGRDRRPRRLLVLVLDRAAIGAGGGDGDRLAGGERVESGDDVVVRRLDIGEAGRRLVVDRAHIGEPPG